MKSTIIPYLNSTNIFLKCFFKELYNSSLSAINQVFKNYNSSLGQMTFENSIQHNNDGNHITIIDDKKYNQRKVSSLNKPKKFNGSELNKMNRLM